MRFLADMGISQGVVAWLRAHGRDAMHLREQQLHRLPDGDIFQKATRKQRVILTFDLDFSEILALSRDERRERGGVPADEHPECPCNRAFGARS